MRKSAAALIMALLVIAAAGTSFAQSIPKPSVPEFTVKMVAYPYNVPTTHSIDPFTGQDVVHEGYHVNNQSIEVGIENQPFTPYEIDINGSRWTINLFYNIRIRGHFSGDWIELYRPSDGYPQQWYDSDHTVLSYVLAEGDADTVLGTKMIKLTAGGQVDFQVQAMIGYIHRVIMGPGPFDVPYVFTGESSDWSNTQTVKIPAEAPTTPTDGGTPSDGGTQQTEPRSLVLDVTVVGIIAAAVAFALSSLCLRRRRREAAKT